MKRIYTTLFLLLALCLFSVPALAQSFTVDNLNYEVSSVDDKTVTLTIVADKSSAFPGALEIPSSVYDPQGIRYSVTSIGNSAFAGCSSLTSVTIPNSVTSIGATAFADCSSLTSVAIPNSVTFIGSMAFFYCTSLTSVAIPNSVTSIEERTFDSCFSLASVTIPNSVTSIGNWAFWHSSLTSVTIPNSVTSIGLGAFSYCSNLKEVYVLPQTPPACSSSAFDDVDLSLCTLLVPEESISLYRTSDTWRDFHNIVPIPLNPDYAFEISPEPLPQGKSVSMPVLLTNPENVITVQFDLFLPDGITLDTDEYGDFIITPGERCNSTHVFSAVTVGNCIRVAGYSSKNRPYADTGAPLIYLPLSAASDVQTGQTLPVEIRNILVTIEDGLKVAKVPDSRTLIEITKPYTPGDVNGDGHFSANDIDFCLELILGYDVEGAIPQAADVNGDGSVSVTDIANIVSLILAEADTPGPVAAPAKSRSETGTPAYYMNPLEVSTDSRTTLEVGFRNSDMQAIALQCDIYLPDGVEVETDEYGDPVIALSSGRTAGHVITTARVSSGAYRVISYSDRNRPYKGTDGVIFTLPLVVKAPAGRYEIRLENSYVTEAGTLRELPCPDSMTILTVNASTGIDDVTIDADEAVKIYNAFGVLLFEGKYSDVRLNRGIYIIVTKDCRYKKLIE